MTFAPGPPRPDPLEPDRNQIEIFADALFRYADPAGVVSIRGFYEGDETKPFRITPTSLKGGVKFVVEVAEDDARRAAQDPRPVVFCPPIASFSTRDSAAEKDLLEGYTLSVECDQRPAEAQKKLEALLGPATVSVRSGGIWTDTTGTPHDKLHLHWRLNKPARGADLLKLKALRANAADAVGGDPTCKSIAHPMRWPGSWHRKKDPRLCEIAALDADREIDLDAALSLIKPEARPEIERQDAPAPGSGISLDQATAGIVAGENLHVSITSAAAGLLPTGMWDGAAVKHLRALMGQSAAPHDARWRARYDDIPRAVSSARALIDADPNRSNGQWEQVPPGEEPEAPLPKLVLHKRVKGLVREWNVPGWVPKRTPTLIQGDGGLGKSTLLQQWQSSCATNALWIGLSVEEIATLGVYTEDEDQDVDLRQDAIDDYYGIDCVATGKMHTLAMAGEDSEMVVFDKLGNPHLTKFYRQIAAAAMDYHVRGIGLDVAVDSYGGNEIARRQVRAFMRAIGKLGRMIDGPVIVTAHVSQAGIQSDGGHSASTDWSNASRSRAYLSAPKEGADGPVDPDARIFSRKKANHARIGETIKLRWQNGVFVPEVRAANFYRRPVEDVFLSLLDAMTSEGQKVSPKTRAGNYTPAAFMRRPPKEREDYQRADFERAMQALFRHPRRIKIAPYGRASWGNEQIIRTGSEEDLS